MSNNPIESFIQLGLSICKILEYESSRYKSNEENAQLQGVEETA
jgi:hypothetical protein